MGRLFVVSNSAYTECMYVHMDMCVCVYAQSFLLCAIHTHLSIRLSSLICVGNISIFSLPFPSLLLNLLIFRRNIETHNHNIILQLLINGKLESGLVFLPYKLVDFTPLFSLRHCVVVPFASCLQLYITIN